MVMYKSGTLVERGSYWSPLNGRFFTMREEGMLPADERNSYLKLSPAVLLVIAPLSGMMYVMFLPLLGIGVFLISWLVPLIGTLSSVATTGARISSGVGGRRSSFNWSPSRAYFSGAPKKKKAGAPGRAEKNSDKNGRR